MRWVSVGVYTFPMANMSFVNNGHDEVSSSKSFPVASVSFVKNWHDEVSLSWYVYISYG